MIAYENTIQQFKKDARAKRLVNFLCAEYETAAGKPVPGELRYALKYAVSIIYTGLSILRSGVNPKAGIRIELEEGAHATHMKLIFASFADSSFRYTILGLYAGSSVKLTNAEDIVNFREGSVNWTMIHPSMLMSSYVRRLFRGIPEEEAHTVNYESASWLFDCFYSPDSDIITDYNDQLTDEFPVFYANDEDEVSHFLEPVLRSGGGIEALRKLGTIEKMSASRPPEGKNDDQIYLISSITNNVRRMRKAWYIIEGETGTGKGEIIRDVVDILRAEGKTVEMLKGGEEPDGKPDLLVISQETGGTYEQLDSAGVSVYLCDGLREPDLENFETDAVLTSLAEECGAQLYISHLKQSVSFADGGRGMRWLVNRLQLAEIRREDYDPDLYEIRLVNSKEEFASEGGEDMANVVLPPNVTYNSETGIISIKKPQKKGIYNALSSGRKGILLLVSDPELKKYLEGEITALKQRQKWVRNFVSELAEGKKPSAKQMEELAKDSMAVNEKRNAEYMKKARASLGRVAWAKMDEQSRMWITTALMAYDDMKEYDRMVDFSGVCVQIGKACENELKKRIFSAFVEYERESYGEGYFLDKLAPECFAKASGKRAGGKKLLKADKISMGQLSYIMGLDDNGRVTNQAVWREFEAFAKKKLLVNAANPLKTVRAQLPVIGKIRDEYRNRSAHSHAITIVDARECIEYVVTVQKKLGVLLDEYRF